MRLEDAMLLDEDEAKLMQAVADGAARLAAHEEREAKRIAAGLPTDMGRYLRGEEIRD